jgi:putative oxidoreductase
MRHELLPADRVADSPTRLVWVPQTALVVAIAAGGVLKLAGEPAMVEMFTTIGAGQWLRYAVGALELTGAVGLLIPRLAGLAAAGIVALLAAATVTNVAILDEPPYLPLAYLVVAAVVAWFRRPRNRSVLILRGRRAG